MEDDGGGFVPSKFGRAEDGQRFMSRGDHMNGSYFGRSMSMELPQSSFDGTAVNDHQDIRRPRRRPRFPQARNPLKDKVSFVSPILQRVAKLLDFFESSYGFGASFGYTRK